MTDSKPALWSPGDWNAFFGFGTNILVNVLTLTALLRYVLKLPDDIVFGRILPATGLMLFLSTIYYAWLAYKLAKKEGRDTVCALPSGISVPHMFVVVFVIMLPIASTTGDPIKGWEAGLTWVFVQSFVLMAGGFIAPYIKMITPRAALLGALAGVSIAFISLRPALDMYMDPVIGVVCFAILLASWFGGVRYWRGIPAGLVAIAVGSLIAWGGLAFGFNFGGMSLDKLGASFAGFGFSVPMPAIGHVFGGFEYLSVILVTAIPFGIYDLVEAMDNVESAEAGGDHFPTTRVLTADGVVSLIGCLLGNPFINAVYIGHPGWKAIGGRIGYSAATGVMVLILSWFGIVAVLMALIPVVAISPILLYIGMLIGAQAFQETPKTHAPAIILALSPAGGRLGQADDRQRAGRRRHQRRRGGHRQAGRHRGALPRPGTARQRRHPDQPDPGGRHGLHHRPHLWPGGGLRAGRLRADLLRLHAQRGHRPGAEPDRCLGYLVVAGMLYGCARLTMPASQTSPLSDHGLEQPAL